MAKKCIFLVFSTIFLQSVTAKYLVEHKSVMQDLINYKSYNNKPKEGHIDSETIYYSPFREIDDTVNVTNYHNVQVTLSREKRADPTFRGNPKTKQEVWARNFNIITTIYDQSSSLIALLKKLILQHLNACIPVVLYDEFIEQSEGLILQRLFQVIF